MKNPTYGTAIPDGYDVEPAMHRPFDTDVITNAEPMRGAGVKSKLQQMKDRSLEGWHHVQHSMTARSGRGLQRIGEWRRTVSDRGVAMRNSLENRVGELKPLIRDKAMALKSDMQTNAPRWAGIAAGAGLVLGIGGRMLRHRMHHRLHRPDMYSSLVIIEGSC